VLINT